MNKKVRKGGKPYPAIITAPPIGVTGPRNRNLSRFKTSAYILDENTKLPTAIAGPANRCTENRGWVDRNINARPLYIC